MSWSAVPGALVHTLASAVAVKESFWAVYGYLLARCGGTGLAEDLTAESFQALLAGPADHVVGRRLLSARRPACSCS